MIKEKPEIVREWLMNDDIETLNYQLSDTILEAGYEIIDSHTTKWNGHTAVNWVLDEGMAFLRTSGTDQKLFFEMSSFNHEYHLRFVIRLKQMILIRSGNLLR